ncbi:hypothetical protein B0I35DRAFT_431227 [Stachybotrys elegans]|uniref:Uncharacterized protein n=1 Tax=Stachybotrys elegans TaxID=80388 RepID=A0A8K0SU45_9HYPO|nr:hypothetical protein B0I35DRAFT_431227 [Stachybotrys elegans]
MLLGILAHFSAWTGRYEACDIILIGVAWLGINDYLVGRKYGDKRWAWTPLVSSFAFALCGLFGLTQGQE